MEPTYDATAPASRAKAKVTHAPLPTFHDLPDLYNPPRRRLHPMLLTGFLFLGATATFYGAEAVLPAEYKPSRFTGGYERATTEARTQGELVARIGYDAKLKLIETQAVQWQASCKAGLDNWNNYYKAAYERANAGYQLAAALQKQYAGVRLSTAQSSLGGEISIANAATTFGYILGLLDPESGQKTLDFAEGARQAALKKLDEAANNGITVSTEGWNTGIPDPSELPQSVKCEIPSALTAAQPSKEG